MYHILQCSHTTTSKGNFYSSFWKALCLEVSWFPLEWWSHWHGFFHHPTSSRWWWKSCKVSTSPHQCPKNGKYMWCPRSILTRQGLIGGPFIHESSDLIKLQRKYQSPHHWWYSGCQETKLPKCLLKFGDYLYSWGSTTQKFSSLFHAKNHMPTKKRKSLNPCQNFHANKKSHSIPTKISHDQRINDPKKKNQCPTKILSQLKLFTCVNQKFLHVQSNQKFLHVQSQQKIPTRPKS